MMMRTSQTSYQRIALNLILLQFFPETFLSSASDAVVETWEPEDRFLQSTDSIGFCDDCFCIPSDGENCPEAMPRTDYSSIISNLRTLRWDNPIALNCNFATDPDCDTEPPIQDGGGACVLEIRSPWYARNLRWCPRWFSYSTVTYAGTVEEALAEGKIVTHTGPCGACSSLRDLAVYLEQGSLLEDRATQCGFVGVAAGGTWAAQLCFRGLGFTPGCARAWAANTALVSQVCLDLCLAYRFNGSVANGPAPGCELADCLQCDEDNAGPFFKRLAGRTRRTSGLLTGIVRGCSELANITHVDPCAE